MVAFHDRRKKQYESVDEVVSSFALGEGDTLSKNLIDGRYFVRGEKKVEGGRDFVLHEVLPNGRVIERGRADRRYRAQGLANDLNATSVYEI